MEFQTCQTPISVNVADAESLLGAVRARLSAGEGFAIATINLDHLVKLHCEPEFVRDYVRQDFIVADGNPIVWLSKLAKRPVRLVPGSDMVLPLARLAAEAGAPVALFGSTQESLKASGAALQSRVPELEIAAAIAPPMGFDPRGSFAVKALEEIEKSGARLVFVALGAPKQEAFAALGRSRSPELGFASIGAGLDFYSGAQTRAPRIVRALALEWAWRMLQSPARLVPRYARCFAILPRLVRDALALRNR